MQRKYIYGFIALSFAISMELVLGLHLIKTKEMKRNSGQPARSQLVSTISIPKRTKQASPATEAGLIEQGTGYPVGDELSSFLERDLGYSAGEEGWADEGYPAGDAGAMPDEDHPPGSEPADSDGSGWTAPDDSYPGPGNIQYDYPENDYWQNYPAPEEPQPTAVPPTATLPVPTATLALPTATAEQPTATQVPAEQATASPTIPPTPVTPEPTQAQASTATTTPPLAAAASLVSVRAAQAPALDGGAGDAAWSEAQALMVDTSGGANQSATRVTIKSVYDDENVYFLITWADPTQSFLLNPWEKQADGSWKRLVGAETQGNDENQYSQDKLALLWPIKDSLPGFSPGNETGQGCTVACHSAEAVPDKTLGLMTTGGPDQIADLWQLKTVLNAGQVDDGYLDGTPYSKDDRRAGLHSDPGEGGYRANKTKDGNAPAFMPKDGGERTGAPGYIVDAEKEELADRLFAPAERVPGVLKAPFEGDRGDIRAAWSYQDGAWTLEITRKRVTGSEYDVQFDDMEKSYFFALATFDNTQVRHAVQGGVIAFQFDK